MKFQAVTDDNRKLNLNWDHINLYLSRWKPGTPFEIEIVRRVPKKSDPMRKYYFSTVLPPILEDLGYEKDEDILFHEQMKINYFRIKRDKLGIYRNVPSVFSNESDVPVPEKKKFVDWLIRKAAKRGIYIPDPGE